MAASNRDLIEQELDDLLMNLSTRETEIRAEDAALRVKRDEAKEIRLRARNLRMALFALDGDTAKTVDDADAANNEHIEGTEG